MPRCLEMSKESAQIRAIKGETRRVSIHTPWDLTGYILASQLRDSNGVGALIATPSLVLGINPTTGLNGAISLTFSSAQTDTLIPGRSDYAFDIRMTAPNGDVTYTPKVWLLVMDRVTQ